MTCISFTFSDYDIFDDTVPSEYELSDKQISVITSAIALLLDETTWADRSPQAISFVEDILANIT